VVAGERRKRRSPLQESSNSIFGQLVEAGKKESVEVT